MKLTPRYDAPPIIAIDGAAGDQYEPVVRQRRRLAALLAELDDDAWRSATRCDGWTVKDVIAHLDGTNVFWRHSVLAGLAGEPTRVLANFDPASTPPLMIEASRETEPAEVLDQFIASNEAFLATLADLDEAQWSTVAESPAGHVPMRLLAHHALWDCWVHERDIALPLGLTPTEEPDEVRSCLRYAAALSPALAISSGTELGGVFAVDANDPESCFVLDVGESVAVRDGSAPDAAPCLRGAAVELTEALSIRAPLPSSTPEDWRRLLVGLAVAFDADLDAADL